MNSIDEGRVLDNFSVAVMTGVNELAERHGILPHEFVAVLDTAVEGHGASLRFESPPPDAKLPAFEKMLEDLGVPESGELAGSEAAIYDAIQSALRRAPASRRSR